MAAKKKKKTEKVFNDRGRKIFRKRIPRAEIVFSAFFIGFTALMGIWFAEQKDTYDPSERDISMEVLIEQSVEDKLYEPPLKRWVDPAVARSAGGVVGPDLGIFPDVIIADGWELPGRIEEFDWDTLYEKIDGQEDQYKQYGFERLHHASLERPADDLTLTIELYDMGAFSNALGVFAAQRTAGRNVENLNGAYFYMTEVGAAGFVDKYYFKLVGNAESDAILKHSERIVEAFSKGIGDSGEATISSNAFKVLVDELGVDFQNIAYAKEDAFQYAFAKEFWFGKTADAGDSARYYVHEAENEDAARKLFDQFIEEQQFEYTVVNQDDTSALMKHDYLDTYFTIARKGAFVYGIEGAADEAKAEAARQALKSAVAQAPASPSAGDGSAPETAETAEQTATAESDTLNEEI